MAEDKTITLTQKEGDRLAVRHAGDVTVHGSEKQAAIQHVIQSSDKQPIVHMVCWDEEACAVDVRGRITLAGDEQNPVRVRMTHTFENLHVQEHKVATKLAEPIHHALQMRTPLELRFCNPWHFASDYVVEVKLADSRLLSIRLTGATVANPQPCADDNPCPPAPGPPAHP